MKYLTVFCVLVLCVCMLCSFLPTKSETEIYSDVIRIHVIAESDGEADQMMKLSVRDAVLKELGGLLSGEEDTGRTAEIIEQNLDLLRDVACETLSSAGDPCKAQVVLSRVYYPTKRYDGVTLPAGEYLSLQIKIGDAQGHNWWGVLYPQLALGAASDRETLVRTGFSSGQIDILTGGTKPEYKLKFKLLELFG